MAEYVGWCTEALTGPTQWGPGDVQGILMRKVDGGWEVASGHYCSSERYAEHDIEQWHYKRLAVDGDTYEWVGTLSPSEAEARFPEAKAQ